MADSHALLVVDDEAVVCQACQRIFSRQGFTVDVNTDARQGLVWAADREYEIILLDIKMPVIDGIQFLEQLREKKPEVPLKQAEKRVEAPKAEATPKAEQEPQTQQPKEFTITAAEFARIVKEFGAEVAAQAVAEGGGYEKAQQLHYQRVAEENKKLTARIAEMAKDGGKPAEFKDAESGKKRRMFTNI